jgi:hypothetical protein
MKTYKKNYIGKGTRHESLPIVRVTLKVSEALKFQHEFNGEQYMTFEVAAMKEADKFGRTHTAYVSTEEKTQGAAPEKAAASKKKTRKPKAEKAEA